MGATGVLLLVLAVPQSSEAVKALERSRDAFLESVAGLTAAQLEFKPRPEADSVLDIARYIAENEAKPEGQLTTLSAVLDHFEPARARTIARAKKGEDTSAYVKFTEKWTERIRRIRTAPMFPKGPSGK